MESRVEPQHKVALELVGLMQQHNSNVFFFFFSKQRFNRLEREEVIPRFRSISFLYY
jgi:hypothetical protein